MRLAGNPIASVDRRTVIGRLQAAGSRDPDLLYARKAGLLRPATVARAAGVALLLAGGLAWLPLHRARLAVPLLLLGGWLWWRGSRNRKAIETGFADYLAGWPAE